MNSFPMPVPKVSICLPTYNRADALAITLESILGQLFEDFEIIICDDCSTDNTEQVVNKYQDSRIRYYKNNRNLKMPLNLNKCINYARGEYIVVFHDHDLYDPSLVQKMVDLLEQDRHIGFVHTGVYKLIEGKRKPHIGPWKERTSGKKMLQRLLWSWKNPVYALIMARKTCYQEVGLYNPRFGFISDEDMWMRLCMEYDVGYIPEPLVVIAPREEDHPYRHFRWDIIQICVLIHQQNLHSFYYTRKTKFAIAKIFFQLLKNLFYFRNFLFSLHTQDKNTIDQGIKIIDTECGSLTRILTFGIYQIFNIVVAIRNTTHTGKRSF